MSWFKTAFDDFYLSLYRHRNEQDAQRAVAFLLREGIVQPDRPGLDLCCGPGRHLVELSKAGLNVVGLDLSQPLLHAASAKIRSLRLEQKLVRASMERLPFRNGFDWVVNVFTSFGYFANDEDNARVISEVARVLRPGGVFLIDFLNAPHVRATLVPSSRETTPDGWKVDVTRAIEGDPPRVVKRMTVRKAQPRAAVPHREIVESVRLFDCCDLKAMLKNAGLTVKQSWGDFDGRTWAENAPRCILLAQK